MKSISRTVAASALAVGLAASLGLATASSASAAPVCPTGTVSVGGVCKGRSWSVEKPIIRAGRISAVGNRIPIGY